MELKENQIIYVGDPMCSWCYGIAPELQKLADHYKDQYSYKLLMGGLRPNGTETLTKSMREMLKHHWEQVESRSGQKFGYKILENDSDFVYDTEKPCRAVVTANKLDSTKTQQFYDSVQKAFYLDNEDTNDVKTYLKICEELNLDKGEFEKLFNDDLTRKDTWDEFAWAKQVGVTGFPSVLLFTGGTLYAITLGYNTFEGMQKAVEGIQTEVVSTQ